MIPTVLLLAGTAEARDFAKRAKSPRLRLVASLAGLTREPIIYPCETRFGGFGGVDAMAAWLRDEQVAAIVDATHPFAERITRHAAAAAAQTDVPLLTLRRAPWASAGRSFARMRDIAAALPAGARVLLTTGQGETAPFVARTDVDFVLRSIEPIEELPEHIKMLSMRPPFSLDDEIALFRAHEITHLVTKNAGGARPAKLDAADALGVEVFSVKMPPAPAETDVLMGVQAALEWVAALGFFAGVEGPPSRGRGSG